MVIYHGEFSTNLILPWCILKNWSLNWGQGAAEMDPGALPCLGPVVICAPGRQLCRQACTTAGSSPACEMNSSSSQQAMVWPLWPSSSGQVQRDLGSCCQDWATRTSTYLGQSQAAAWQGTGTPIGMGHAGDSSALHDSEKQPGWRQKPGAQGKHPAREGRGKRARCGWRVDEEGEPEGMQWGPGWSVAASFRQANLQDLPCIQFEPHTSSGHLSCSALRSWCLGSGCAKLSVPPGQLGWLELPPLGLVQGPASRGHGALAGCTEPRQEGSRLGVYSKWLLFLKKMK